MTLVRDPTPDQEDRPQLDEVDVHDVLSNERRQVTLEILRDNGDSMTTRELSERVAERETGEQPPPRNIRQSAYVSLQQTHLPKLDRLGIIDYDGDAKQVSLTGEAEQVVGAMDAERGRTHFELVVTAAALTGVFLLVISRLSGAGLVATGADVLLGALLLGIAGLAATRLG